MRKSLATLALGAAITGGTIAGAAVVLPAFAGADPGNGALAGGHRGHGPGGEALAEVLGLDADALRTALRSGSTLRDVATQQGVDPQTLVDAIVADMTSRIDEGVASGRINEEKAAELRANATTKATEMLDRTAPAPGEGGPRGGHRGHGPGGEALAEVLGLDADALRTALRSGSTLRDIATQQGVDPQTLVDAIVADMTSRIDEGVAVGRINDEKAAELRANATTMANNMVDRTAPGEHGPRGGMKGAGMRGAGAVA